MQSRRKGFRGISASTHRKPETPVTRKRHRAPGRQSPGTSGTSGPRHSRLWHRPHRTTHPPVSQQARALPPEPIHTVSQPQTRVTPPRRPQITPLSSVSLPLTYIGFFNGGRLPTAARYLRPRTPRSVIGHADLQLINLPLGLTRIGTAVRCQDTGQIPSVARTHWNQWQRKQK